MTRSLRDGPTGLGDGAESVATRLPLYVATTTIAKNHINDSRILDEEDFGSVSHPGEHKSTMHQASMIIEISPQCDAATLGVFKRIID